MDSVCTFAGAVGRTCGGVHGGQTSGFTSENAWYPADCSRLRCSTTPIRAFRAAGPRIIGVLALGHTPKAASSAATPMVVDGAMPATNIVGIEAQTKFVGDYEPVRGVVFKITFDSGTFYVTPPRGSRQPLVHESGATYAVGRNGSGSTATFLADARWPNRRHPHSAGRQRANDAERSDSPTA